MRPLVSDLLRIWKAATRRIGKAKRKIVKRFIFYERPSKHAMFLQVKKQLASSNRSHRVVVDAACQWAWHRDLVFPTNIAYYGIDLRHDFLVRAKRTRPHDTFLNVDILHLHRYFPASSVDCIVSTNTLEYLRLRDRLKAIRIFHSILNSDGQIFLSLVDARSNALALALARRLFSHVALFRYRNPFSRVFEFGLCDAIGCYDLNNHRRWLRLPLSLAARALCKLENMLAALPYPFNQNVLLICSGKRANAPSGRQKLALVNVVEDGERILLPLVAGQQPHSYD